MHRSRMITREHRSQPAAALAFLMLRIFSPTAARQLTRWLAFVVSSRSLSHSSLFQQSEISSGPAGGGARHTLLPTHGPCLTPQRRAAARPARRQLRFCEHAPSMRELSSSILHRDKRIWAGLALGADAGPAPTYNVGAISEFIVAAKGNGKGADCCRRTRPAAVRVLPRAPRARLAVG
jgi:hypothetical protein